MPLGDPGENERRPSADRAASSAGAQANALRRSMSRSQARPRSLRTTSYQGQLRDFRCIDSVSRQHRRAGSRSGHGRRRVRRRRFLEVLCDRRRFRRLSGRASFAIDTPTGARRSIADANNNLGEGYGGLAYDSTTGTMFAASTTCGSSSHLWTIDRATGATTLVGEITGAACIVAIAVDAQGEMYGIDIVDRCAVRDRQVECDCGD